jgi:hypothetical protein
MLLAKKLPQRTRKIPGPGNGEAPPLAEACALVAAETFTLVAALAAALARLFSDIWKAQFTSHAPAINNRQGRRIDSMVERLDRSAELTAEASTSARIADYPAPAIVLFSARRRDFAGVNPPLPPLRAGCGHTGERIGPTSSSTVGTIASAEGRRRRRSHSFTAP